MKKILIITVLIVLVLISIIVGINVKTKSQKVVKIENEKYEEYLNKIIYGTDVITLINKATNSNRINDVKKDEKENYIDNKKNSIQIDIEFIVDHEQRKTQIYKMEKITNLGTTEFIRNFNSAKFKCTEKKYHAQTGKISYIKFTQEYE